MLIKMSAAEWIAIDDNGGYLARRDADGSDYLVTVPAGFPLFIYCLCGDQGGTIVVDGDGDGYVWRLGAGDGNAVRDGGGNGCARRGGTGKGYAERCGTGKGSAYVRGAKQYPSCSKNWRKDRRNTGKELT